MAEPLLEVRGAVKRFGGIVAADRAHLSIAAGELHALIGPNGAGKTTLIHLVSGALAPDEGRIVFDGIEVTRAPMHERVAAGIVRSFQSTSLFGRFTALDNVQLAIQGRDGARSRLFRRSSLDGAMFDEAREMLARLDLAGRASVAARELSHGEQRRLEIGMAIAARPKVLLLDEPTAGLGPEETARMLELLGEIRSRQAIVLVEHDMDVVFRLADRISVLVYGRVIATGTPQEIRADGEVRRAYLGESAAA